MYKLILCRMYLKRLLIIILLLIIANLIMSYIFVPLLKTTNVQSIDNNLIFYQGEEVSRYQNYAVDNNLQYELSPGISGTKAEALALPPNTIEDIYLYDLKYLKDTTKQLIENNIDSLNKDNDKYIALNKVYLSSYPQMINHFKTSNEQLEITAMLAGRYPDRPTDVLIPEILAIRLANELNVDSYEQLLDTSISVRNIDFTIVGVYSGGNKLIVNSQSKVANEDAIFIQFNSKEEKNSFFDTFDQANFTNSSDFYIANIKYQLPKIMNIVFITFGLIFVMGEQLQYVRVLNHNQYRFSNYLIPLTLPTVIIVLITLLI